MARILAAVRAGDVVRHTITIPEGMTSEAVSNALAQSEVLTGVAPVPPEGAVLPENLSGRTRRGSRGGAEAHDG